MVETSGRGRLRGKPADTGSPLAIKLMFLYVVGERLILIRFIRAYMCNAVAFLWLYCVLQFICVRLSFLELFCVIVYLCVLLLC